MLAQAQVCIDCMHVKSHSSHKSVGVTKRCHSTGDFADVKGTSHNGNNTVNGQGRVPGSGISGEGEIEAHVVDSAHVDGTRGLVVLREQGKCVVVRKDGRDRAVTLPGRHLTEVVSSTAGNTVVVVHLHFDAVEGVNQRHGSSRGPGERTLRVWDTKVEVAEQGELTLAVFLVEPEQLQNGVVEVNLDGAAQVTGVNRVSIAYLQLGDEVLVGLLGVDAALHGVQVDVVRGQYTVQHVTSGDIGGGDLVVVRVGSHQRGGESNDQLVTSTQGHGDLHLVVLQGNQRHVQLVVASVVEGQRDVHGLVASGPVSQVSDVVELTNHVLEVLSGLTGVALPDLQEIPVNGIEDGSTNLEIGTANHSVSDSVGPGDDSVSDGDGTSVDRVSVTGLNGSLGKSKGRHMDSQIGLAKQVTVSGDHRHHAASKANGTLEANIGLANRKVGNTAVALLEQGNLRVNVQVSVLGTDGSQFSEATR